MRLDLACGESPAEGYEGVDWLAPGARHRVDLLRFPWPWEDGTVEALRCSHWLEHVPAAWVRSDGVIVPAPTAEGDRDLLCAVMDEAWRVLVPGGVFDVVVPSGRSDRAFQDPTHRRFFVEASFRYFNRNWRISHGVEHYLGSCDFEVETCLIVPDELLTLPEYVQEARYRHEWNTTIDLRVRLIAKKPPCP